MPPAGTPHPVKTGESWANLARSLGIDPWDLIDFNFPGTKLAKLGDLQRAARQVNWYLREYVGCRVHDGKNYEFSTGLTGGKGAWKGGVIYVPPRGGPAPPPAPAPRTIVQIPSLNLSPSVRGVIDALGIRLPTRARLLDPKEEARGRGVYGASLVYDDIYVADSIGMSSRAVTVALPAGSRWIVVLNLGPYAFDNPNSDAATLIHELAHAWQSQHHPDRPWQYMVNCARSQAEASAISAAVAASNNRWLRLAGRIGGGPGLPAIDLGEASAYAYIPGKPLGDYGGEQVAQQVEDSQFPLSAGLAGTALARVVAIRNHVKSVGAGVRDPENLRSLGTTRYEHKNFTGVVWH